MQGQIEGYNDGRRDGYAAGTRDECREAEEALYAEGYPAGFFLAYREYELATCWQGFYCVLSHVF